MKIAGKILISFCLFSLLSATNANASVEEIADGVYYSEYQGGDCSASCPVVEAQAKAFCKKIGMTAEFTMDCTCSKVKSLPGVVRELGVSIDMLGYTSNRDGPGKRIFLCN